MGNLVFKKGPGVGEADPRRAGATSGRRRAGFLVKNFDQKFACRARFFWPKKFCQKPRLATADFG